VSRTHCLCSLQTADLLFGFSIDGGGTEKGILTPFSIISSIQSGVFRVAQKDK
jgi:hypothetical protein